MDPDHAVTAADAATKDDCDRRHKAWRWIVGLAAPLLGGLILYGLNESRYATLVGRKAEAAANEVEHKFDAHAQVQKEHDKHIDISLNEIKFDLGEMDDKLDAILKGP